MTTSPTSLIIADDHPVFRMGLREVIERKEEFRVLGEANDGEEALDMIKRLKPELALLDLRMPKMSGLEVMRCCTKEKLPVTFIILTMCDEEEMFRKAIELGAMGYLLKESAVNEIVQGITVVARGDYFFSPALAVRTIAKRRNHQQSVAIFEALTPTERRILQMIAEYKSTTEIAGELCVSPRTIEHHREHMCRKLDLTGRYALVRFALENVNQWDVIPT